MRRALAKRPPAPADAYVAPDARELVVAGRTPLADLGVRSASAPSAHGGGWSGAAAHSTRRRCRAVHRRYAGDRVLLVSVLKL